MTTTKQAAAIAVVEKGDAVKPRAFRFTDDFLKRAMAPAKLKGRREIIQFEDGTGLGARVSSSNVSFIGQLKRKGRKPYRWTIGRWGVITVEQARAAVVVRAGKIALGVDLEAEARAEEAKRKEEEGAEEVRRFTVRVMVDRWKRDYLSGLRPAHAKAAYLRVLHHFAGLLDVPAALIDRKEVRLLARAAETKRRVGRGKRVVGGKEASRNALTALKSAYNWALGEELIDADPLNGLNLPPKGNGRERVLSLDETRRIWVASGRLDYPGKHFVRLLLLTGCRRNEVKGLRWDEIVDETDDKGRVVGKSIELPGGRTKTGAGHRVPLSTAALQVLDEAKRFQTAGSPYVLTYSGQTALSNVALVKTALDEALDDEIKGWVWHDTRRTIVTHLAARGFNPVVIDLLLGHTPSRLSSTARIYQKFEHADTRREALEAWAATVTGRSAEVVDLKGKARRRG
jgi:integrase